METRHEVTEWKQAEAALRNSLAACDRAVNELADQKLALDQHATVAVTDVMGTITYVNDECCLFSQYSKDELIGKNHRVLNSGHHSREFFTEMYDAISNGRVWQGEIKKVAKDGSSYWEDTTIVPFVDAMAGLGSTLPSGRTPREASWRQRLTLNRRRAWAEQWKN